MSSAVQVCQTCTIPAADLESHELQSRLAAARAVRAAQRSQLVQTVAEADSVRQRSLRLAQRLRDCAQLPYASRASLSTFPKPPPGSEREVCLVIATFHFDPTLLE